MQRAIEKVKQDHLILWRNVAFSTYDAGQDIVVVRLYRHSVLVQHLDALPVNTSDFHPELANSDQHGYALSAE